MVKGEITITVKIEGLSEFQELPVTLLQGAQLQDLFPALINLYGNNVRAHLYDTLTGKLGVFLAIINSEAVRIQEQLSYPLADGDEVFIISPLGGG